MPQEKYVKLAEFDNAIPAHSMRILLEANGVEAHVHGDFAVETGGTDSVSVVVRETDLAIAKRVVAEVPAASEVLVPEWICDCGETVDKGFQVCWSCGQACPDVDLDWRLETGDWRLGILAPEVVADVARLQVVASRFPEIWRIRDGLWSGEMSRFGDSLGCDWELWLWAC